MKARNALKLILELHRNPDCSPTDKVALAPMTLRQVREALEEIDSNDSRVKQIRNDPKVGRGSCTSIDEANTDTELVDKMNEDGVTIVNAVKWARELEDLLLENATNFRLGEDNDPELLRLAEFRAK